MNWLSHPYRSALGQTAVASEERHVREMLELLLFTSPGERVQRPDFGCGLDQLIFAGNSSKLAVSVEMTVRAAVQRWLGNVLTLESLRVSAQDATLNIELEYRLRATGESARTTLSRSLP